MDKWVMWAVWRTPPVQNAGQTASNCRVVTCAGGSASTSVKLRDDVLVAQPVPSQAASNLGELPASGPMLVQFQAKTADVWVLFGPNSSVVVDPADGTAANFGDRIVKDTTVTYVLNPTDHAYMAYASTGSGVLKYRASGPPSNNRP